MPDCCIDPAVRKAMDLDAGAARAAALLADGAERPRVACVRSQVAQLHTKAAPVACSADLLAADEASIPRCTNLGMLDHLVGERRGVELRDHQWIAIPSVSPGREMKWRLTLVPLSFARQIWLKSLPYM